MVISAPVTRAAEVVRRLDRAGLWTRYIQTFRGGEEFETPLLPPLRKASCDREHCESWAALSFHRLVHLHSPLERSSRRAFYGLLPGFLRFSGPSISAENWMRLDWEVYWSEIVARLLAPALLLHFALVFVARNGPALNLKLVAVYPCLSFCCLST